MFTKRKKFGEQYAKAMVILDALAISKMVSSNDDEAFKEWNSLKKWLLAPEVNEQKMPLYLLRVQNFSQRVFRLKNSPKDKKCYYDILLKLSELTSREHDEKTLRELGFGDWAVPKVSIATYPECLNTLDKDVKKYIDGLLIW